MQHLRRRSISILLPLLVVIALDPAPVRATTAGPVTELAATPAGIEQRSPSIDWDGSAYFIVWEDSRNAAMTGVDLYFARIDSSGMLLDANGQQLLTPNVAHDQTQPQIVYNDLAASHVFVWLDSRGSDNDIWAARAIQGSGLVLDQAGVQISAESTPDATPSAACLPQSCLFLWQATLIGGGSEIRARRFYPDLTPLDTAAAAIVSSSANNEAKPRVLSLLGTTYLASWEDDRNTATTGLDLFARTLPETAMISAAAGTPITTAMLRQTESDLAPLGSGVGVVWQDQRAGALIDDIYTRRFDTSLSPLGAEALVSGAAQDQLRPRIAGDSMRGMVVWQDRRTGAYGFTHGARLDASGNVRDPESFPLLVASANVFEHAIAKGPGADYLVAAVRFDAAASRIMYRIVRDEPPAGSMTASGTLEVPADGTARAMLTFGPAKGATPPMYDVVDGTLYTVTLSRADVSFDVPDRDPVLPGMQVYAVNGAVSFGLTSLGHGSVDVTVASVEGTSSGSATVIFDNVPPVATSVVVGPPNPTSSDGLMLTYVYSDVNSDPEMGTTIEWTRNSAVQSAFANRTSVSAGSLVRGDQWRARVTPRDGLNAGGFVFSNTVIVGNTPPRALNVRIEPNMGVKTGTGLRGRYSFDDVDGDAQSPDTVLRWFDHGTEVPALRGLTDVPGAMVVKGQIWSFSVEPHDSLSAGLEVVSSTVAVENTVPVANAGANGGVIERRRLTLDGRGSSDVDPQDSLAYRWRQTSGTAVMLSSTSSATPSFVAPSIQSTEVLEFELVVNDGEADSAADRVTVQVSPVADSDNDGLDDEEEVMYGTDPALADTDRDGLGDFVEVMMAHTDPRDEDSDDDGVRDGDEGRACRECMPAAPLSDEDGDGLIAALDPDSDDDGIKDGTELGIHQPLAGTDVSVGNYVEDADPTTVTDPTRADTDGDGVPDGVEDANHDGKVEVGESDPNDPADPPVACTPGGNQCPQGTECVGGTCQTPVATDGGLMCRSLAEQHIECCMGGCTGGTVVTPVCARQGALEQCPVGAMQCQSGACSSAPMPKADSGCSCATSSARTDSSAVGIVVLLALLLVVRARSISRSGRRRRWGLGGAGC